MHKNTRLFILFLAVVVAALFGIKMSNMATGGPTQVLPSGTPVAVENVSPKTYSYVGCGISFSAPEFEVKETKEALKLTQKITGEEIDIVCGKSLPTPPLTKDKIESTNIASQSATLYHDQNVKTQKPLDVVKFKHPKTQLEVAVFGYGETYKALVKSIQLL